MGGVGMLAKAPDVIKRLLARSFLKAKAHEYSVLAVAMVVAVVGVFFALRGPAPAVSELAFIEHSVLGEQAGSVVPASCDAASIANGGTPGSHWWGDCQVACPSAPGYYYDPYYDPSATACPVICPSGTTKINGACLPPRVRLQAGNTNPFLYVKLWADATYIDPDYPTEYVRWDVQGTGATCTGYNALYGTPITLPSGQKLVPPPSSTGKTYTYQLTCTLGGESITQTVKVYVPKDPNLSCFVADTKVTMADGTKRPIQDLRVGDVVLTSQGTAPVKKVLRVPHDGPLYAFNGSGKYFVTSSHPFMTEDGWKSIDPEATKRTNPDLAVSKLNVGDVLIGEHGEKILLKQIDQKVLRTTVYNMEVGRSNEYYADGYLVHNKMIP
jgi:hypothetical protein